MKSAAEWRARIRKMSDKSRRHIDISDTDVSDIDVSIGRRQGISESANRRSQRNNFTIKDVEGCLSCFTGNDKFRSAIGVREHEHLTRVE